MHRRGKVGATYDFCGLMSAKRVPRNPRDTSPIPRPPTARLCEVFPCRLHAIQDFLMLGQRQGCISTAGGRVRCVGAFAPSGAPHGAAMVGDAPRERLGGAPGLARVQPQAFWADAAFGARRPRRRRPSLRGLLRAQTLRLKVPAYALRMLLRGPSLRTVLVA